MKGAKGGKRDQIISNNFREFNEEIKDAVILEDELEQKSFKAKKKVEKDIEDRIYEDKIKSLEQEEVILSPLTDKDLQNSEIIEDKENIVDKEEIIEEEAKTKDEEINQQQEIIIENKINEKEEVEKNLIEEEKELELTEEIKQEKTKKIEIDNKIYEQEAIVFYEIEKMIKEDYYDLKDLEYKIEIISYKAEQEVLKEKIEKLKIELEELIKRFDLLKDKYEHLDITKELIGLHSLNNAYIETMVQKYKKEVKDATRVEDLLKKVEETKAYIGVIETLITIEDKKNNLEEKVEEKYNEFDIRDKEFEELERRAIDVEKINNEISKFSKNIETITKDLEEKVKETVNITNKVERITRMVPNMNRVINATMMLATAAAIPNNLLGNLLKASLMAGAINNMAHILEPREEIRHKQEISYTDYNKDILNNMHNIKDINKMIDDALYNISDIKEKFKKDFKEYAGLIPGYKELIENIDKIEDELEQQQYYIEKYENQVKEQYNKNDQKKYIKEYEVNN